MSDTDSLAFTHFAVGPDLNQTLCGNEPGMLSCGEWLVDCKYCRALKGWKDHPPCPQRDPKACPACSHGDADSSLCNSCQVGADYTRELITGALRVLADSYLDIYKHGAPMDIWAWTGNLADRIDDGEFTKPRSTEPPF